MRLAFITQDFPPKTGGIQTYSVELAKRFALNSDFVCVIAPNVQGASEVDALLPFNVKRVSSTEPLLGWAGMLWLPRWFKSNRIDTAFHTQWTTLPVSVLMKKMGIVNKIFVAAHGRELLFNPFGDGVAGRFYDWYRKKMLDYADHFFPVSDYTAELLKGEGIESQKILVVNNGTDPREFYPMDVEDLKSELNLKGKKVLLTITRLVSRKGIDTVLEALPDVIENNPEVFYLIVGEGDYQSQLKAIVQKKGLQDFVQFKGKVPYKDLNSYYNVCDVFVMPSKTEIPDVEGFGLVFLEANACGKPVIGSESGGIPSAIIHDKTGLLVEEQNPGKLSAAINRLLQNPNVAQQLGKAGRERVLKEANWDKAAEKILRNMR